MIPIGLRKETEKGDEVSSPQFETNSSKAQFRQSPFDRFTFGDGEPIRSDRSDPVSLPKLAQESRRD